jgi:hypothetical protein
MKTAANGREVQHEVLLKIKRRCALDQVPELAGKQPQSHG